MYQENLALNARILETYSMYINLFIYESAHQDCNNAFIKVCNLLYLFSIHSPAGTPNRIDLTQQDIADILTISLVNVTNNLARLRKEKIIVSHRKWIEITDYPKLVSSIHFCSSDSEKFPLSIFPSLISAPEQLSANSSAFRPNPLPPEVAKRTIFFPAKS